MSNLELSVPQDKLYIKPISAEDLSPFTIAKVRDLFSFFNGELVHIELQPKITDAQIDFVNDFAAISSRIVHLEIGGYKVKIPSLRHERGLLARMPAIVRDISREAGHSDLQEACQKHQADLLATEESWLDVTAHMASGEISMPKPYSKLQLKKPGQPHMRESMQDYCDGLNRFIMLLAEANDGLITDYFVFHQVEQLFISYRAMEEQQAAYPSRIQKASSFLSKIVPQAYLKKEVLR